MALDQSIGQKTNYGALLTLTTVFFFWGFVAASNTILIGLFKDKFDLLQWQSQLVEFAFYTAYFVGSLIYFIISSIKEDPLLKYGYKKGLIGGLTISAIGALGFIPAAELSSFWLMLISLFTVGLGFSLLQIVANPYVIALGDPKTGAHRVSFAGGINSIGTMIGPLIFNYVLFGKVSDIDTSKVSVGSVELPYIVLAVCFVFLAVVLSRIKLPEINKANDTAENTNTQTIDRSSVFKYPQLVLGMLAIFIYVGVEVSIQSNLPALMEQKNILNKAPKFTAHFISLYWGSLMIGRWMQSIGVFSISKALKYALYIIVPAGAFGTILGFNYIIGMNISDFYDYWPYILLLILAFIISKDRPGFTLILFSVLGLIMMVLGMMTTGKLAVYLFISGGLFCSIMWPCIFSLAIAGLGKHSNKASSLLIMMIFGGALIPPLQGFIGDQIGIHNSYWVPVFCFAYLAVYGIIATQSLKKQGINYEDQ
jgi:FHS family L-fucose permease-like MFS transporter